MRLIFKIQLVEIIVFTEARALKTTEVAASVASNVATAMLCFTIYLFPKFHQNTAITF